METRSLILVALCVVSSEPLSEALEALRPLERAPRHLERAPRPLERALKSRSDEFGAYANDFTQEYEPIAYAAIPLHHPMPVIAILSDNPLAPTTPKIYGQKYASSVKQSSYAKPDYQSYMPEYTKDSDYQNYASVEYEKPYSLEYQKQKPYSVEYQKPYNQYPKHTPMEYVKPYPAEYTKTYAPVEYPKHYSPDYIKPDYIKPVYIKPDYIKPDYIKPDYIKPYAPVEYRPHPSDFVKPYASVDAPTILYARPNKDGGYTYHRRPLKNRNAKRPQKEKPMIIRVHKYRVIRDRRSGLSGY